MHLLRRFNKDLIAFVQTPLHHTHEGDDTQIVVEPRIDDQRLQGFIVRSFRRRNDFHQVPQQLINAHPGLGAAGHDVRHVQPNNVFDFTGHTFRLGLGQINFVQYRQNFQALLDGRVAIRHALRLDTLSRVYHQQRAFTGRQRTRDFVAEIDVPGGINKIQLVTFPV